MALIDQPPADLATTDALAAIGDPDTLELTDIYMSGKILTSLANPPGRGEDLVLTIRVRPTGAGDAWPDDDTAPERPYIKTRLVNCWPASETEPKSKEELDAEAKAEAEKNQPPLFAVPDGSPEPDDAEFDGGPEFSGGEE